MAGLSAGSETTTRIAEDKGITSFSESVQILQAK